MTLKKTLPILFILLFSFKSYANSDQSLQAREFIGKFCDKIIKITQDKEISDISKIQEIINHIDISVNAKWISRFVLGSNYRKMSEDQIAKFSKIYRLYMINTYSPKFTNYNSYGINVIDVEKMTRFYLVKTKFDIESSQKPINIDFRVKLFDDKFLIIDIIAEGISLVETQRSEFGSTISTKGIDKFIEIMNDKLSKAIVKNEEGEIKSEK